MAADLTSAGRQGVAINALYDFWTPARHYQAYHGGMRILSESASARLATPITVRPDEINQTALGYNPRERSWNYLEPWLGGDWRVRDIVDDQLIAMESCLYQAAVRREDLLRSFYRIGKRAVERRYAICVRPSPRIKTIQALRRSCWKRSPSARWRSIAQREAFTASGKRYPSGSYIIRMQQPYSSFAKTLLERQNYPDLRLYPGGPPKRPYDVTAQHVAFADGRLRGHSAIRHSPSIPPRANTFDFPAVSKGTILAATDTESWRALNRALASGRRVWRDMTTGDFHLENRPEAGCRVK